jgi:tight adherence protein B
MMLFIAFVTMVLLTFTVVAIVLRPSEEQKAVVKRLGDIKTPDGTLARSNELDLLLKQASEGSFGWLEDLLQQMGMGEKMALLILQADSHSTAGKVVLWSLGPAFGVMLITALITGAVPLAIILGSVVAVVPFLLLKMKRTKRTAAFDKVLPDAIDMMARSLRAGHSLVASLGVVAEHAAAPLGNEFGEVFRKQNFGIPMRDALLQMLERIPSQDLRVIVTGMLVQKDTGGNLAEILDRTNHVIRERMKIQGEIRTHTAQGRMTGYILCALPIVMLVLINMINPGYSKVLLEPGIGRMLLYAGAGLLVLGGLVIRAIVNGIEV